ncbi:acyltransferase family protein [Nonomuraea sp. SBT364]|uniref:acyltransferase family protein n=1 Tax=Nonomuraea sp. SBT364 TaxID=1580530 RepID=UPI00066A4ACF|nr:acyltransferase [Nonomuraea sp. SBT364]
MTTATTAATAGPSGGRKNYIDWLRNLGILFLFPYHTARVFNDGASFYVKGEVNTFSTVLVQLSYWFMPLLFLLAGSASFYALKRRSAGRYVGERVSRLLVPLLFGVLVVVPPQAYYALRFHRGYEGSYAGFLWTYFTDFSDWSEYEGGISPGHLWFILFLFLISAALVQPMQALARRGYTPGWLRRPLPAVLLPVVLLIALSYLPEAGGKNIFVFAAYFLLGFLIATDDAIMDMIERRRPLFLALAVCGGAGVLMLGGQEGPPATAVRDLACWTALLAMLGYGRRHLNGGPRAVAYFNEAAFPLYVLHQTFLVAVGFYVVEHADAGPGPYVLIMTVSFALSLATYEIVRRWGPTRFALGLSRRKPPAAVGAASAGGTTRRS